jgi:hypothetical protein
MTCAAEHQAALFLGGALSADARVDFGHHLLSCPDCWREVDEARRGRALVESARTAAPAALRDRVRGLVEAECATLQASAVRPPAARRWRVPVATAVAAACAVVAMVTVGGGSGEPPSLRQAVADFAEERLPGDELPEQGAPDLTQLRLRPVGAGGGAYAGLDVDGFAYRDDVGRRVVVYLSDEPFPEAPGAEHLAAADGPWIVHRGDVTVLCARFPHALLVVGRDEQLVRDAATELGVL